MEKHQAFLAMMVHKKEGLKKAGEGTSSPKAEVTKGPPQQVNTTLKISTDQTSSNATADISPETIPPSCGSKRKASHEK